MKLVGSCFGLIFSAAALASPDFAKVKGYDLEYEIAGEGSEVILLEAGGSASMSDWDPVFKQMSEHAKVIRYSRVDNGQSTAIKQHFTSRDYAEHASILLTELADMKGGMSNQYLDFWSKHPLPDYPEIKDMPVTVIASVRTMENSPNLFFTEQGRKMWGELWQAWANAFPQGKSVLTECHGLFSVVTLLGYI